MHLYKKILLLVVYSGFIGLLYMQWQKEDAEREAKLHAIASRLSHHILSDDISDQATGEAVDADWLVTQHSNRSTVKEGLKSQHDDRVVTVKTQDQDMKTGKSTMTPHRDTSHRSKQYCHPLYNISKGQEGQVNSKDYKLVNIHVIIRHGDRSPIYSLPNHPSPKLSCLITPQFAMDNLTAQYLKYVAAMKKTNLKMFPNENMCEGSQLTPRGLKQHLHNGRHLGQIYVDRLKLFGENVSDWSQVYMRSTHYTRTYQSAWAFLYGFMGNITLPEKVSLVTESYATNFCSPKLSGVPCFCPAVGTLDALLRKEHYQLSNNHKLYQSVKKKVGSVLGVSVSNVPWIGAILDVLMSYTCHNMAIPCISKTKQCFNKDHVADMWQASDELNVEELESASRIKHNDLVMYPLMREIANRYRNITKGISSNKMTLYSGHDKTLTPLTVAFGINDAKWPPYASRVVMELYQHIESSLYYLRVLYNGKDMTPQLRFCDTLYKGLCPLDNYLNFVFQDQLALYNSTTYRQACSL